MTIGFDCSHCHHRIKVGAPLAGKRVRCPKCNLVVRVPTPLIQTKPAANAPEPPLALDALDDPDALKSHQTEDEPARATFAWPLVLVGSITLVGLLALLWAYLASP